MGDENHIRTLGDYSLPSHEGYQNTIEFLYGNNVVPLLFETIRLVQNECSFRELWSEDPNQHIKDFLKIVDSLDLNVKNRERNLVEPIKLVDKKNELEDGADDESVKSMKEELTGWEMKAEVLVEMPSIGRLKYVNALIDQGSDVNVMLISIYNRLTNEKLVGTDIRLSLSNHSYIYPIGIAEDVLIDIAGYVYPMDFIILDIEEDKNKPFILGTPFLRPRLDLIRGQ
ncbi:zinc finger, CCHC-type containing protein [Tanacetum coccineum]